MCWRCTWCGVRSGGRCDRRRGSSGRIAVSAESGWRLGLSVRPLEHRSDCIGLAGALCRWRIGWEGSRSRRCMASRPAAKRWWLGTELRSLNQYVGFGYRPASTQKACRAVGLAGRTEMAVADNWPRDRLAAPHQDNHDHWALGIGPARWVAFLPRDGGLGDTDGNLYARVAESPGAGPSRRRSPPNSGGTGLPHLQTLQRWRLESRFVESFGIRGSLLSRDDWTSIGEPKGHTIQSD